MKAWENFLKLQERELGRDTVDKWLKTLIITQFDARNLYLEAKDSFQVIWFEEHIRKKVDALLCNNNKQSIKVHLSVPYSTPAKTKTSRNKQAVVEKQPFEIAFDELDPHCTFSSLVVTEKNLLAYKLLSKVTSYDPVSGKCIISENERDLASFNPIYLFGNTGTGKTHMLMATAHALMSQGLNVIYIRAEKFTEHVVSAIRSGEMSRFRAAYRNVDALLIDDVHIFSRKSATQEELFHTFNTLHLSGKQIILSAGCSPAELGHIEPRLVSRFEWGIVVPIEPLSVEEQRKVLEKKADAFRFKLHHKVQDFLLNTFTSSSKSLVKALEALILRLYLKKQSKLTISQLTVTMVKKLISDLLEQEIQTAITSETITDHVSEYFDIRSVDLFNKMQAREFVLPRQIAMYFCRSKLKMPYTKIGELFHRDHSTVMTSVKLIEKAIGTHDGEVVDAVVTISKKIKHHDKAKTI